VNRTQKIHSLKTRIANRELRVETINQLLRDEILTNTKPYIHEKTKLIGELAELYMQKTQMEME
jgi:tetrahydrodipicolinate N-succinyltransferase